ncbi:ABC transporter ATP-binding protein [Patescibacteria group bacterium]
MKYLLEYKKEVIALSILGIFSAIANGSVPYIVGRFFDAILSPEKVFVGTLFEMPLWLLLIIIFAIVQVVADVVDWKNEVGREKVAFDLYSISLAKGWGHLIKLPKYFYNKTNIAEVTDKFSRSSNFLMQITMIFIDLVPQFLSLFIGFIFIFYIHWIFVLILGLGIYLYVFALTKIIPAVIDIALKERSVWEDVWGGGYNTLFHIDTVKRFTSENYEFQKNLKSFKKASGLSTLLSIKQGDITFFQRIIVTSTRVTVFIFSIYFIKNGLITLGELIALNGYAMMVFTPFVQLGSNWQIVQRGLIAISKANKVLGENTENYHPQNAVKIKELKGDIEFKNVNFYYEKKDGYVLKDINLKVNAGEIIALVGESGVGKSTLVELISAYYFAQKGKVLVDGVDIKKVDLEFLRSNIAVVPQEVSLFNDTIKNNIKYGSFKATDEEVEKAVLEANANEFIDKFPKKYKQIVGERGVKLSVGQKQRVAIARAILRDPKILILDEPTSALDSKAEKMITESLKNLMKGRTTFIVAHRLSTVRDADKIVVFEKGRIAEEGKHEELMKIENGVYRKLYELHIGLS